MKFKALFLLVLMSSTKYLHAAEFQWDRFVRAIDQISIIAPDAVSIKATITQDLSKEEFSSRRALVSAFRDNPSEILRQSPNAFAHNEAELHTMAEAMVKEIDDEPFHESSEIVMKRDGVRFYKSITRRVRMTPEDPLVSSNGLEYTCDGTMLIGVDRQNKRATIEAAPGQPINVEKLLETHGLESPRMELASLYAVFSGVYLRSDKGQCQLVLSNLDVKDATVVKPVRQSQNNGKKIVKDMIAVVTLDPVTLVPVQIEICSNVNATEVVVERIKYEYTKMQGIPIKIDKEMFSDGKDAQPILKTRQQFELLEYKTDAALPRVTTEIPKGYMIYDLLANEQYQSGSDIDLLDRIVEDAQDASRTASPSPADDRSNQRESK